MLISLIFSRFFDFNFIIQYWLFIFALVLLYHATFCHMGSCKCRHGLSDPWNTCFIVHILFSLYFLTLSCFVFPK